MFEDMKKLAEALPHVLELLERATCALEKIADGYAVDEPVAMFDGEPFTDERRIA